MLFALSRTVCCKGGVAAELFRNYEQIRFAASEYAREARCTFQGGLPLVHLITCCVSFFSLSLSG